MNTAKAILRCTLLTLFLNVPFAYSTNYYLSEKGDDTNSGKTPTTPWRTIPRINKVSFKAGDSILFNRGDVFRGELMVKQSGNSKRPIVFSAYGSGHNPILSGTELLKMDDFRKNQMVSFPIQKPVYQLYVNDALQTLARTPNIGFYTMGKGIEKTGFETDNVLPDSLYTDATIRMRTIDWVFENRIIKSAKNGTITFSKDSHYKIDKGYGYYLENKAAFLDSIGEWYSNNNTLKFLTEDHSSIKKAEATVYNNAFTLSPNTQHVIIENIVIEKYNGTGIYVSKNSANILIHNNIIRDINLYGILIDTLSQKIRVEKNELADIHGRGITGVRVSNCIIKENTVKRVGVLQGQGHSAVNGMISIVIENDEKNNLLSTSNKNLIARNLVDSNGYAGIRMDGKNSICEYNVVKNSSLFLNDAGGIYCWGKIKNLTSHNIIRNNIVMNVVGNVEATPGNGYAANGIYVDNNATDVLVENNTILNVVSAGILINDIAPKNTIRGNTIVNASKGIVFSEWAHKDSLHSCVVTQNTVVAMHSSQKLISLTTYLAPTFNPATFNDNLYVNAHDGYVVQRNGDPEKGLRRSDDLKLPIWQRDFKQDLNSKSIVMKNVQVLYNDTFEPKKIDLGNGKYINKYGEDMNGILILEACSSVLIGDK